MRSYRQEAWGGLKRGDVRVDSTNGPNGLIRVPLLDPSVLESSLAELLARHPVLNIRIEERDDYPWLVPLASPVAPLQVLSFDENAPKEEVEAAIAQVVWRPFDVLRGPLFRAYAVSHGSDAYIGLVAHHFVADIASLSILMGDLLRIYELSLRRAPITLPFAGLSYGDYLAGLQAWIASPAGCAARQLAVRRLLDLPALDLGPVLDSTGPEREEFMLESESVDRLRATARALSTSPFVILLAVQNTLLRRFSPSSEVGLKVISSGRNAPALLRTVGNLADRQYVVTDLSDADSFAAVVARTHQAFGFSQKHAFVRNDFIQRDLTDLGVVGAAPVFNFVSLAGGRPPPPSTRSPVARPPLRVPPPSHTAPTRPRDFYYLVLHDEGWRMHGRIRYGRGHIAGFVSDFVDAVDRCCRDSAGA